MTALDDYARSLRATAAAVAELSDVPGSPDYVGPGARRQLLSMLSGAEQELGGTEPLASPRALDLARVLADGDGPRDPRHPIFAAFRALDRARIAAALETGRLRMVPRATAQKLAERDADGRRAYWQALRDAGVLVVTVVDERGTQALPQLTDTDGGHWNPAFTDLDLAQHWADGLGASGRTEVATVTVEWLAELAVGGGAAGIVLNPLNENVAFPAGDLSRLTTAKPPEQSPDIAAGSQISYGVPAELPEGVRSAVIGAANDVPGVVRATVVALIVDSGAPRLAAVLDASDERDIHRFLGALHSRLPRGEQLDVISAEEPFGRRVIDELPPLFSRA